MRFEGRACWITGDPIMLRRAISNLLSNTMRYTPPGKTITLRIKEADDQIHIIVENPGTPIAPEHLPRLFDRFYRVDPSRQRKGEGSGIGLAIVKSIVIIPSRARPNDCFIISLISPHRRNKINKFTSLLAVVFLFQLA